jgi:hypothetical protein
MAFPREQNSQPARSFTSHLLKTSLLAAAAVCALAVLPLGAQQTTYSTSSNHALLAGEDIDGASIASSPNPTPAAASAALPQYGGSGGGYSGYHGSRWDHVAFEVGGGFTAPIGNDVNGGFTTAIGDGNRYGTDGWGGNILVGGGWAFTKRFTLLGEYEYNSNKIPGRTLSAVYNSDASDFSANGIASIGGNVHTNSITAEPVFYYYNSDKHKYAGYVIGGVGWYHKTISFTAPVEEDTFYGVYVVNSTFSSYSDNGVGVNFGTGVSFKPFGTDSRAKLFGEVRYVWADTPAETAAEASNPNSTVLHTGTEGLVPVTVGLRF